MPVFDFEGPDGKTHSIEGPGGSTPEEAFKMLQQHLGTAPEQPPVSTLTDTAKSIGAGLGNQTLGVLGGPGYVSDLLAHGSKIASDYLANKLGFESSGPVGKSLLPTPQSLRDTVPDPIVSPDYQPQTAFGKVGKIGAEYSLGLADPAVLASPAGFIRTAATNVAAPASASEAAGKVFEGTEAARCGVAEETRERGSERGEREGPGVRRGSRGRGGDDKGGCGGLAVTRASARAPDGIPMQSHGADSGEVPHDVRQLGTECLADRVKGERT